MMFYDKKPGTLVDGLLYGNTICITTCWILGYDIASKKFDIFPPPDGTNKVFGLTILGMIGGSLSVARNLEEAAIEIWKLEKKGDNKHGWIKVMTIKKNLQILVPICILKNGEVLIMTYDNNGRLFKRSRTELYDPVKGRFRKLIVGLKEWS
ncbi:hypothetical protein PTKIN_Ptkin06aG0177000 [Pterospermum kingtungense]